MFFIKRTSTSRITFPTLSVKNQITYDIHGSASSLYKHPHYFSNSLFQLNDKLLLLQLFSRLAHINATL